MSLDTVLEELLNAFPASFSSPVDWPTVREQSKAFLPQIIGPAGKVAVASVEDINISATVRVRVYRPFAATQRTMVHFHGGGWTAGDLDVVDHTVRALCEALPAVVVSCTYRLAPEHPFPAGYEDALTAVTWALEHAGELGGNPAQVVIAGDSAGGNLAAALTLTLREAARGKDAAVRRRPLPPLEAQLLLYPAVDLRKSAFESPSFRADRDPGLRAYTMAELESTYLDGHSADDWRISPLAASDFSDLPPALIVVLSVDPLRDQAVEYAQRLLDAGTPCSVLEFSHLTHGFVHLMGVVPAARDAFETVVGRFQQILST